MPVRLQRSLLFTVVMCAVIAPAAFGAPTVVPSAVRTTPATGGTTWDATKDFAASNPNGAWSYGSGVTGTSFSPYTIYDADCLHYWDEHGLACWTAALYYNDPFVGLNTTGHWFQCCWGPIVPPNALYLHPAPDWEPADTIVRWTAPVTGTYTIFGFFEILDTTAPTGIVGLVFRNGTPLYRGELLGPPAQYPDQVGGREYFYFARVPMNAGDVLSFGVNSDGTFYYDSTGFNATITTTPSAPPCATCTQ